MPTMFRVLPALFALALPLGASGLLARARGHAPAVSAVNKCHVPVDELLKNFQAHGVDFLIRSCHGVRNETANETANETGPDLCEKIEDAQEELKTCIASPTCWPGKEAFLQHVIDQLEKEKGKYGCAGAPAAASFVVHVSQLVDEVENHGIAFFANETKNETKGEDVCKKLEEAKAELKTCKDSPTCWPGKEGYLQILIDKFEAYEKKHGCE
mmetsp:Transcript_3271/g.5285  ORF Transcript_3271/g.5285 Transcript_3271/m.5285 type:complete len:213 (+) Transcript_3271:59-697(+)